MDIYSQNILDHYKNPHNKGRLDHPTHTAIEHNLSCGDSIRIDLIIKKGKVTEASFEGSGCAISQAAASMLTDYLIGKTTTQISKISKDQILKMLGIPIGPGRLKCALLAISTARKAASH